MTENFLYLFENDFLALFPEIFLLNAIIILLFFGVLKTSLIKVPPLVENISWLGLFSIFLTLCLVSHNPIHQSILFYNTLIIDDFTYFFKIILLSSSFAAILLSIDYMKEERFNAFEYVLFLLFSTLSMLLMISSYDFISMYLTVEFQSLCFYVLAASKRNSEFSTEAGLKYFILGAFSSGILLFGFSIIYGFTGVTNFGELAILFTGLGETSGMTWATPLQTSQFSNGIILGILFVAVGFLFKLTAAPFHMWAPDVYEGSPTAITAFFSITPKIAILAVFIRLFLYSFYDLIFPWQKIILLCSVASMIVGALAAISQHKIKRLLAYSSIGHIGYMLLGFSCATIEGIEALFIYLIVYIIMTINIFAIILSLQGRSPESSGETSLTRIKYLADLGMLAKTNPILAFTLTCTMFSMAGIPPLAGFCSKFYIFFAALGSSLYFFAFLGVFTSVISCFYYIRFIKIMYFEKPSTWLIYKPMDKAKSILLGMTLFFMIFFFCYPSPLFFMAHKVALSLSL